MVVNLSADDTHLYIKTHITTHINKYTNNITVRSTNILIHNAPEFSQTALLYSASTLWNGLPSKLQR